MNVGTFFSDVHRFHLAVRFWNVFEIFNVIFISTARCLDYFTKSNENFLSYYQLLLLSVLVYLMHMRQIRKWKKVVLVRGWLFVFVQKKNQLVYGRVHFWWIKILRERENNNFPKSLEKRKNKKRKRWVEFKWTMMWSRSFVSWSRKFFLFSLFVNNEWIKHLGVPIGGHTHVRTYTRQTHTRRSQSTFSPLHQMIILYEKGHLIWKSFSVNF
jgi:hypothetical protein